MLNVNNKYCELKTTNKNVSTPLTSHFTLMTILLNLLLATTLQMNCPSSTLTSDLGIENIGEPSAGAIEEGLRRTFLPDFLLVGVVPPPATGCSTDSSSV